MKRLVALSLIVYLFLLSACSSSGRITHNSTSRSITSLDYGLNSVIWEQRSGEYRALCYQAFALAKIELEKAIAANPGAALAIVTDIDETVLDNSPQQADDLLHKTTYTEESWIRWTNQAKANALPGAVAFFQFANANKVSCFYISNRRPVEKESSIRNLRQAGFPQADSAHVMMKAETSDKEQRRQEVALHYKIVMLLGDNLNDFDKMFYKQGADKRQELVDANHASFGSRFIILPNAIYGDWEAALWKDEKPSPKEALRKKYAALRGY